MGCILQYKALRAAVKRIYARRQSPGIRGCEGTHFGRAILRCYRTSILPTSSLASLHVSRFFFAQSMWHLAYAIYQQNVSFPSAMPRRETPTMYRLRSSSFSSWKRFKSFNTPALASFTSCSQTSSACSSWPNVRQAHRKFWESCLRVPSSLSSCQLYPVSFVPGRRRRFHERRD